MLVVVRMNDDLMINGSEAGETEGRGTWRDDGKERVLGTNE